MKLDNIKKARETDTTEHQDLIQCPGCTQFVKKKEYYKSFNPEHQLGLSPYCKKCWIEKSSNLIGELDLEKFKHTLMINDRPYIHELFVSSYKEFKTPRGLIGSYLRKLALQQYQLMTWKDSVFEVVKEEKRQRSKPVDYDLYELEQKWGYGFSDAELVAFERKFEHLKSAAPPQTAIHEDAMMTYVRYRVKADLAISRDDVISAQKWGQLASQAQETAKLAPNKLSKSDLSGGIDNFAELSKQIELATDGIVGILPKFTSQPKDVPDLILHAYISYNRQLRGMPPVDYEEIYNFYQQRLKETTFSDDEEQSNKTLAETDLIDVEEVDNDV